MQEKKRYTQNVNKDYFDESQWGHACHLRGGATSVFRCPSALTGEVCGWRCDEEVVSSSYSTLTPIFSVFNKYRLSSIRKLETERRKIDIPNQVQLVFSTY